MESGRGFAAGPVGMQVGRRGKLAGLPERQHIVEAREQADQAGEDRGVQHRQRAGPGGQNGGFRAHVGQQAGKRRGRGGVGCCVHVRHYT